MRPSLKNLIGKENLVGAEIGVKVGKNAKNILDNLSIKKLYLIDPFQNKTWKEASKKKLFNYSDKIKWLNFYSFDAVKYIKDNELDFIYIDGDHRYEGVKNDIKNYYSKVKIGGLIAGHDYDKRRDFGIVQAVNEFFNKKNINTAICDIPTKYDITDWWVWRTK